MNAKKRKIKLTPSAIEDRIEFLRNAIRSATVSHGVPCMCTLCEALQFDYMASVGEINFKFKDRR